MNKKSGIIGKGDPGKGKWRSVPQWPAVGVKPRDGKCRNLGWDWGNVKSKG